jgi:hypothetical protein
MADRRLKLQSRIVAAGREESGMMLIEIVVSAALLVLVMLSVLAGVDGPGATAASDQKRSTAGALASQDQDRMRGMRAIDLSNYYSTRTVTVAGTVYTIVSRADWVNDSTGSVSCLNNSNTANYLSLSSTVSWPNIRTGKAVSLASVLAPPAGAFGSGGNLSVQIQDQANNAVVGTSVNLTGTATASAATNSLGCAYFGYMTAGNYTVGLNQAGYVDPAGVTAVSVASSVTAGTTTTVVHQYALASQIAVSFDTKVGASFVPAQAYSTSVAQSGIPAGYLAFTPAPGVLQSTITANPIFPFATAYGVYAGACTSDNHVTYSSTYFNTYPGSVTTTPGSSSAVTVHLPALNIAVTRGGSALLNANVSVTPTGAGCNETYPHVKTNAQGALAAPGYPFGPYTLCADDGTRRVTVTNVQNTNVNGLSPAQALVIPTSGATSTCP